MRILYITPVLSVPPYAGSMQRTLHVCRQLRQCAGVTMLAVSSQYNPDSVELCKQACDEFLQIPLKSFDDIPFGLGCFLRKWHMHWPVARGLRADRNAQERFQELLNHYDIVWFHTLQAAFPFDKVRTIPHSVMDLDDLNQCKYGLRSRYDKTLRLQLSAKVQAFKWKRHELNALKQYNILIVCSDYDKTYLDADNVRVVPNGFDPPPQKPDRSGPDPNRLGFIGTLDYGPNHEGLLWFRDCVWPLIHAQNPNVTLRLIGALPQPKNRILADGFEYLGYVEDTAPEMASWSAMIVPILYGGGTRIKIIEAFSRLCPVVSTPLGAHGITGIHGQHFQLTEQPQQFADFCLQLTTHPEVGRSLAENAWCLFNEKYTWEAIGKSIRDIVQMFTEDNG